MAESNAYFLEDTLVCILLMLPVKSLMRFRSVCKLWYQIISSASFIDAQRMATKDKYLLCAHFDFYALISKEEFTNYRTNYTPELFALLREFINYKLYYYPPLELCVVGKYYYGIKVYGSCNGLLCLADGWSVNSYLNIMLLNPVIRKIKTIPKIPVELLKNEGGTVAFCFSYFDDDYKVIRLSYDFRRSIYRVGVYSLRTDCWKFTTCGSQYNKIDVSDEMPTICVGGVAYFPNSEGIIVCFDLHDERFSEVRFPETLSRYDLSVNCDASVQACGESIALVQIRNGYFKKWVLKNRDATDNNTWETKTVTNMRTKAPNHSMESSDIGAYMLRDFTGNKDDFYLCGNLWITSQVEGFDNYNLTQDLERIDFLTANLVLLNEKTILEPLLEDELEEKERSMLILFRALRLYTG